jgi:hypothetical protein
MPADNFMESLGEKEESGKRYYKSKFRYDEVRNTYYLSRGQGVEMMGGAES